MVPLKMIRLQSRCLSDVALEGRKALSPLLESKVLALTEARRYPSYRFRRLPRMLIPVQRENVCWLTLVIYSSFPNGSYPSYGGH